MSNIKKIQLEMTANGISSLLLSHEADRLYACGYETSDGAVLILENHAYFITDSRYIEVARETVKDAQVILSSTENGESDILKRLITEHNVKELGIQEESLSYAEYLRTEKLLNVKLIPAQKICSTLRQRKEPWEVENIVSAQRIAEAAIEKVLGTIKPGVTEKDIAAELDYLMAKGGAQGLAFDTICVSGANSSKPHGVPSGKMIENGDFVTMDFGCKINGYCSDMTRTVAVGSASDEMRRVYDLVLKAQLAGINAARAGILGKDMDLEGRRVIEDAGYGEFFGHGFGHSVGLFIHEGPSANLRETRPLLAGAVVTAEPGVYLPGRFGVRIEDMVYITENGCENLTKASKELIIL